MTPMPRLYFDNAATSSPKPQAVIDAMVDYATRLGGSPGRGSYFEAREAARLVRRCRERINDLVNGEDPDHIIFTLNTSDALNLAIRGVVLGVLESDPRATAHIVTTELDHNSVLRPLNALIERHPGRLAQTRVPADPATGRVDPDDIRRAVGARSDTVLVALNHASNVTGVIQPAAEVGAVCRAQGVLFLLDAAQSLGHLPVDVRALGADLLAFPGHKGLLGPSGTGGLSIRPGVELRLATVREGGTGSQSDLDVQPETMPDKYEPGSVNAMGLIGLSEGVQFLNEFRFAGLVGIAALRAHEVALMHELLSTLGFIPTPSPPGGGLGRGTPALARESGSIPGLTLHGPLDPSRRVGVFTFSIDGLDPHEAAAILESEFGVLARAGIHCAPLAHRALGSTGALRLSLGPFLTVDDVRHAAGALRELAASTRVYS
ncbi:MAG TPA: hypothetical protein DEB06_04035 [Phycisphaerales bacterium]|nr:hypothetical protein [Phycisphaerales bacterium]